MVRGGESLCSGEDGVCVVALWIYTKDVDGLEGLGGLYILAYICRTLDCTNQIEACAHTLHLTMSVSLLT